MFDFRKTSKKHDPLFLYNKEVEQVKEYKYLGSIVTNTLDWTKNTQTLCQKTNKRLYFLRMMNNIHVDRIILVLFYQSLIQSILTYNANFFYGNETQKNRTRLERVRRATQRVIGHDLTDINCLFEQRVMS